MKPIDYARARAALLGYSYTDTSALALTETKESDEKPAAPAISAGAHQVLFEAITGRDSAVADAHARLRAAINGGRA